MSEGMAGKTVFPAKLLFMCQNKIGDALMVNGFIRISFLWKKPVTGSLPCRKRIPVLKNKIPDFLRKLGITVRAVFGSPDMDTVSGMLNIGTL